MYFLENMLARFIQRGLSGANKNCLGCCAKRCFGNEYSPFIPGGGLEKSQGGYKEESYFKLNDHKLMLRVREQAMRNGGYDTSDLKDALRIVGRWESINDRHREQGLMNKHKNSSEELFFLTEEADNLRRLEQKMRLVVERKLREEHLMKTSAIVQEEFAEKMETFPKMHKVPEFK